MIKVLEGSQGVAEAVRLARVEVISAYPITPQTHIVERLSDFCADGSLKARFLRVESEHSALAALIGASSTGARTFTATSSQGLALMHELLHWTSAARLPIVMAEVNRALAPGWNIWTDQTDSLAQRDTGWMQFYCETGQEVLDTTLQATGWPNRSICRSWSYWMPFSSPIPTNRWTCRTRGPWTAFFLLFSPGSS